MHPPCLDLCGIFGGVKQSVTVVGRGNQRKLRARRQWKDRNALGCISKRSGEMIHALSLIREGLIARPTTTDNDKSHPPPFGMTKIRSFDPSLTAVCTAYPSPPFLTVFTHQSSWASLRPHGRLHLDGRIDFAAICLGQLLQLVVAEIHL
jgi:hypothetical protein